MNRMLIVIFPILAFVLSAYGGDNTQKEVTPYGVSCHLCGAYGYCDKQPAHKKAVNALKSYYEKKGLKAVVIKEGGRFVEADVYRNKEIVDRALFDCRTGRIRSIY